MVVVKVEQLYLLNFLFELYPHLYVLRTLILRASLFARLGFYSCTILYLCHTDNFRYARTTLCCSRKVSRDQVTKEKCVLCSEDTQTIRQLPRLVLLERNTCVPFQLIHFIPLGHTHTHCTHIYLLLEVSVASSVFLKHPLES